jgi:tRNA(Ile)-lysidine synthase
MERESALATLAQLVRDGGLAVEGSRGVALVSGGADSAAAAAGLATALGSEAVTALHLNYRLRADSDRDEETCRELCALLGVELVVEHPQLPPGNVQAAAREARYAAAARLRRERALDWIAAGHTQTDLAETVIYRLASSPGRRALLGLRARHGHVIRPLLGIKRERARSLASAATLPFRDDPTNEEPLYARNRIRNEILPVLREIATDPEATIAETQAELSEEGALLERLAADALRVSGADSAGVISREALEAIDPVIRRFALRRMAELAAGRQIPLSRSRAALISELLGKPEGGVVELGGGVEAHVEHGHVRFSAGPTPEAIETTLTVPGECRFGSWEVRANLESGVPAAEGPERAVLDPETLGWRLIVRGWRDGDRMRPLGLGGTKTLQDLFTDRKVPRSLRHELPVVISEGRIAWIAGVAVSEEFVAQPGAARSTVLTAELTRIRP